VRVGRLDTKDEVLPLRVVTEKGATAGRNSASSTEDLKIRRARLVFDCQVLQAELNQRPRRSGKVGCRATEADVAAEVEAAPAITTGAGG
jgi:hypothetical protein